jgi:hypothetical protein
MRWRRKWRRRRTTTTRRRRRRRRRMTFDFVWSDDDGPHLDKAADQRALVESFESQKKMQDDARAHEDEQLRRAVELSLQAAQQGRACEDSLMEH